MDLSSLCGALEKSLNIKTQGTILSFANQNNKWNEAGDVVAVVKAIDECPDLRGLVLEANTLGVNAAEAIGKALSSHPEFERALWKDLFTGRLKKEIPDALRHLFAGLMKAGAKLKELDLSDNALGPIGVEGMVDVIRSPVCYSLEELRLNNNGLGVTGGTMLARSLLDLEKNARMAGTPLQLRVFICGRNRLEVPGATIFSEFFSAIGTLQEVNMMQNGIFHKGIAAIAKSFSNNPNLKIINLNDNIFTPEGAASMAKHLGSMKNLEVINFGDCLIKTKGAIVIASVLSQGHERLRELHLDSNEINIDGGLAIARAMANKDNLEFLMLDDNTFGDEGQEKLVMLLEQLGKHTCLGSLEGNEEPGSDDESADESADDGDVTSDDQEDEAEKDDLVSVFYNAPTGAHLLPLGTSAPSSLIQAAQLQAQSKAKMDAELSCAMHFKTELSKLLMNLLPLLVDTDSEVKMLAHNCAESVSRQIFELVQNVAENQVTQLLLVHLGLLKSEDKKFKTDWNLRKCMAGLQMLISKPYISTHFKTTLQSFLVRPECKLAAYQPEKDNLLKAIFA